MRQKFSSRFKWELWRWGVITAGPFDTFDPIVRVVNYPFLFKDNDQADLILDGPLGQEIFKSLETSGFKGLHFSENGFRNLTNSKKAVKDPDDIKGLKIRVMASALHRTIWQTLGANPTPMVSVSLYRAASPGIPWGR